MSGNNNIQLKNFFARLKGDKSVWAATALLAVFSFLPIYSASSNLAYLYGDGSTIQYLFSHFIHIFLGFVIMFAVHKVPYQYFKGLSIIGIPIIIGLLIYTLSQGTVIQGAGASRWITIPLINKSFQTSALATVVLMVYVARYLSKIKDKDITFKKSIFPLWIIVFVVVGLILPANFSTAAITFTMVLLLCFIGGYPFKYLLYVVGIGIAILGVFILFTKAFPEIMPNRVDTWSNRIENYMAGENAKDDYQIEKSKMAIARGGITGVGIGKSVERNFLPQSSSDFIFAIIVEEMGLIGGFGVMIAYLWLLFRFLIISTKSNSIFGKLLVIGLGLPIIFQAFINMAVAVQLFPVTGQTLPLISDGGSSIWMTCAAIGIILGVSLKRDEAKEKELKENEEENPLEILSEAI
ncbi:MAG TPA: FtsW/RodA/SpoVE family cell cycle protein [Flavobacteriaceae bacterium]|nr:FtsW/RodA/SpoVE family cell cycle protein [Flavobacteriaceae bacterium]